MALFDKKDSYIPALRVSSEFAERAQDACHRLFLHPPKIRREAWEDLIRIAESGHTLLRPARWMTQELLAELSQTPLDRIKDLFPAPTAIPRRNPVAAYAATVAAAAAVTVLCMSPFLSQRRGTESSIAKATPAATVVVGPSAATLASNEPAPMPVPSAVAPPLLPTPPAILACSVPSQIPAAPVPLASPTPVPTSPKEVPAPKLPEEEILSRPTPARIAAIEPGAKTTSRGSRIKKEKATITGDARDVAVAKTSNTKNTAVAKASTAWDRKEHSIDHQLNTVDRKIAKTGDNQEQENLKEHKKYLQQRKDYVRRSRTYHQNKTRLEWGKEHGTSMLVDSIRASLGF